MKEILYSERFETPIGLLLVVTDAEQRLRALDWGDKGGRMQSLLQSHYGAQGFELSEIRSRSDARRALEAYFEGDIYGIDRIPTRTGGTDFQRRVWTALRKIPAGTTVSYGALAATIGNSAAVRAVGRANGANPIPVVVPCHRVIGADASLTGFGGGLERK